MTENDADFAANPSEESAPHGPRDTSWKMTLAALGVVYGDIGTSPLYAIKESFHPSHGLALAPDNILGILSLVFWSLVLIVSIKYLVYVVRADNHGEGGVLALLGLLIPKLKEDGETNFKRWVVYLGLFGAALLYGDGVITPAITVLGAVEGLQVATPAFQPYVVPIAIAILIALFWSQRRGTERIGTIFGRAMLLWFLALVLTGLPWIFRQPGILKAISPYYAIQFFTQNGWASFMALGSVVLCITGAEALYADMGHFGKTPIRRGWTKIVLPALLINYFGQGALILEKGEAVLSNTFYGLVSGFWIYPLVAVSTAAAIIASQALISGAFSLTTHAVQLGYLPRVRILHTSRDTEGQIFVPRINLFLGISCIALILQFKESSKLASAYGIAVVGTMAITSLLFALVARRLWYWSVAKTALVVGGFLAIDLAFFGANLVKILDGGWVPLFIGIVIFTVMTTWKRGREALSDVLLSQSIPIEDFIAKVQSECPYRVPGTAVFMTLTRNVAPSALLHHYKHNQSLHQQVVLLSVITRHEPEVSAANRVRITEFSSGFSKVVAAYGFTESPDILKILEACKKAGLNVDLDKMSFYLGRETVIPSGRARIATWRKRLFAFLSRNARPATEYFKIPPDRVMEIGAQIQI